MITKNEEEQLWKKPSAAKIDDYLIKPLNPSQILYQVKKILDKKGLVMEKTNRSINRNFRKSAWPFRMI